jgi:hypothetical protein
VTPLGPFNSAAVAGPPSPPYPAMPLGSQQPVAVVMIGLVEGVTGVCTGETKRHNSYEYLFA